MKKILVLLLLILLLFTVWFLLFKERIVDNTDLLNNRVINSELPISDKNDITFERDSADFLEKESEDNNNNIILSQEQGDDPKQSITLSGVDNIIYKESVFDADITDLRKEYTSYAYTDTNLNNTYNPIEVEEKNIVVEEEDINLTIFDGNIPSGQDNESYLRGIYDLIMNTEDLSTNISNTSNINEENSSVSSIAMDEIIRVIKESELYNSPIVKAHVYLYEKRNEFLGGGSSTDSGSGSGILSGVGAGAGVLGGATDSATGAAISVVNTPFGGRILKTILCTCSANTLVYVQDTKTSSVLPLVYQPGVTMLYSNYNVFTPGVNLLGTYTPGTGICLMVSSPCNIIPSIGMMNFTPGVGTSLSPGA